MSKRINAIIYYDGEVRDIENRVVFLLEKTTRLTFNQNIQLPELQTNIRRKIIKSNEMRVLSLKYRFYALVDPFRYDTFDIKSAKGLKIIVSQAKKLTNVDSNMRQHGYFKEVKPTEIIRVV
ncbi:hypothetical protein J1N35_013749 [Gossypium stocksii]|uniref:Uncharacterized protein n=1 Tax=Gossypium stocksii TaxID=47602 RepID=A0A9D4A6Z7_9ROSI|nr:hypothetical protein J1N35_013749 [Gossypium stocksii]